MLTVAVLGPLEVSRDGRGVQVPSGKASELVVRLALEAGAPVLADRLVDDLWGAGGGTTRRNTLQSKVAMLRRAFGDPSVIVSRDGGYALAVEPSGVDAVAALGVVAAASGLLGAGDDRAAVDLCTSTLKLYRGDVLQAAGHGHWVDVHRARLEEAQAQLLEILFTARLRLGDLADVIGALEAAVATYSFQESLWELLITAQYRAGRQADALATYQRVKRQLADELGLDPRPSLQELEQRILVHDGSLDHAPRLVERGDAGSPTGNLPTMTAELIGRETEVTVLSDLLARGPLVEIVGPGGVGKTAVAIAVARGLSLSTGSARSARSSGTWLARLETATTADDVVDALIGAVDGPGGETALFERLKTSSDLVILDNCEHVIAAAASLAVRLLDHAPGLRILCTSQVPLGIEGEVVVELAPLALSDAVELFTRRATAQRLRRTANLDDASVLDLCRSLDGLPLAIELAAARTKTLPVAEITRRIADRFLVLSDPTSSRPERRRSLRSTIGWSYDLLFPDDQRGLGALATFAGGAPLPAVEYVLEALGVPAAAAIDVVGRLASRSLVIVDDDAAPPAAAPPPLQELPLSSARYRLLDSIRAFALEALAEAGLADSARAAHAAWFADRAGASTEGVRSRHQAQHLSFVRTERANIDAALAWSVLHDPLLALEIGNGFGWAWVVLGDSRGAQRILNALQAADAAAQPRDRAAALLLAAWIEASTGSLTRARGHIAEAADVAEAARDSELRARCCYYLAYVDSHQGEFRRAMELTDCGRDIYDMLDRPWDQAANGLFAVRAAMSAGDLARSVEGAEQVRHWLRAIDDPWLQVRGDAMLGELARLEHRFDDAVRLIGRAAERSRELGFQQTEAYQLMSLGRALCHNGDYDTGISTLELAIEKAHATGDVRLAALARVTVGRAFRATGQVSAARTALTDAAAWHREAGGGEQATLGECLLAALDAEERVPDADRRLEQIVERARQRNDAAAEVLALDALARWAADQDDAVAARAQIEAADRRMKEALHLINDGDRTDARWVRGHL